MQFNLILFSLFLGLSSFTHSVWSKGQRAVASVELTPIGSFEATVDKIKGHARKSGSGYTADNIKIKVKDITTGIELRDKHLWKRFKYKKHPYLVLKNGKGKNGKGKAKLEIGGITKKVKFKYKKSGKDLVVDFKIDLEKYKIKDLTYMGVGVKKTIPITATLKIK
jgi:polyisoprenoid-binding protein YceI